MYCNAGNEKDWRASGSDEYYCCANEGGGAMRMSASSEEAIYGLCVIWLFMALRGMLGIVWPIEIAWRLLNSCILVEFWKFLCLFFKAL